VASSGGLPPTPKATYSRYLNVRKGCGLQQRIVAAYGLLPQLEPLFAAEVPGLDWEVTSSEREGSNF